MNLERKRGFRALSSESSGFCPGGAVVESVDVLGHQGDALPQQGEPRQRLMAWVWCAIGDQASTPLIPFPDEYRVALESLGGGELFWAIGAPETLVAPKGGDAGFCRYPSTRKHHDRFSFVQQARSTCNPV